MQINRNALLAALIALILALGFGANEIIDAVDDSASPPSTTEPPTTTVEPPTTTTVSPPSTTTPPPTTTVAPPPTTTTVPEPPPVDSPVVFSCDFTTDCPLDQFVQTRDGFVVGNTTTRADHELAPGWSIDNPICTPPETTRTLVRDQPYEHTYRCVPGGNLDAAHQMSHVQNSSGYNMIGSSPNLVFTDVSRIGFFVNMTSAGNRNFWEVAIIPADQTFTNGMSCGPSLPCNRDNDYDDLGGIGFGTASQEGTGLLVFTPEAPDGLDRRRVTSTTLDNGDRLFDVNCPESGWCPTARIHQGQTSVRDRYEVRIERRDDGLTWFGMEQEDGTFAWRADDIEWPEGDVRVVLKFHGYTNTKDGQGPGFAGNLSPSVGGFTWHWDNFVVEAEGGVNSQVFYDSLPGGNYADHFVTHQYPGCVAFAQGQRNAPTNQDTILPLISCPQGLFGEYLGEGFQYGPVPGAVRG